MTFIILRPAKYSGYLRIPSEIRSELIEKSGLKGVFGWASWSLETHVRMFLCGRSLVLDAELQPRPSFFPLLLMYYAFDFHNDFGAVGSQWMQQ